MSTPPPIEKKIRDGVVKHSKKVMKESQGIEKETEKAGKEIGKSIYKIGEGGVEAGIAIGKGVYGVSKAAVKTGAEVAKTAVAATTFPFRRRRSIKDFFWKAKRGIITGAADNDPAGIVTYIQTGAVAGFKLLWLALLAWPLLVAVEQMSSKISIVTRKSIMSVIMENYGKFWAYLAAIIVLFCNVATISADLAAMSDVASLVTKIPQFIFVWIFGLFFIYILWKKGFAAISRYLFIITPIFLLYIVSAFLFDVPWGQALRDTFIPVFSGINESTAMLAVGFLGTTISPYMIFWESTQEIEEKKTVEHLEKEEKGVFWGMLFTEIIAFFIIIAGAAAFSGNNQLIETAKDAALALEPLGKASFWLFSIGIIGSGLLAIPVLTASTGYSFAEVLNWDKGLSKKFSKAKGFYLIMFFSIIIGMIISLMGFNPILLLLYSQVLNGLLLPVLIVIILLITNSRKIMKSYTNKFWTNFWGIASLLVSVIFIIIMILDWIK